MKKINIKKLHTMKRENKKITALTAYDFSFAKLLSDASGRVFNLYIKKKD